MLVLFIFTISLNCNAQETNNRNYTKYVIENFNSDVAVKNFLQGIGEAYLMFDAILEKENSLDKICFPSNKSFFPSDYFAILKQQYFKWNEKNYPTSMTLYYGLVNTYPCE